MKRRNESDEAPRRRARLSPSWRAGASLLAGLVVVHMASCVGDDPVAVVVDGGTDATAPDGTSDTSTDATTDRDPPPPGCDTPTEPLKNPEKCLVDSFGVFVSPSGDDSNAGTKEKPLKTIGKALQIGRDRVVVCEGEYAGSLDVTRAVEIYGGVSCDFKKAGAKAKVVASKPGYGIKVEKVAALVILADLDVVGMNAAALSESSVGVFVTQSADVKVLRSRVEAGDGADASAARDGSFSYPADALLKGANADDKGTGLFSDDTPGAGGASGTCPGGGSTAGGIGGVPGGQGNDGNPRPPGGAKGGVSGDCSLVAGAGTPGSPGMDRQGATPVATLATTGLTGVKGQDGAPGTIGGGGGGGFGIMGAGGGGGAGGCGGQGGFGGGAGGSSIALLSFSSTVSLEATDLVAKTARPGGAGGKGQIGQAGGFRGNGSGGACQGGNGAKGGDGGGGGGGAGGIAAGIAWSGGKEPTKDATTKITRPTGEGPAGGEGGAGASNKGVDGVHADVFEVK